MSPHSVLAGESGVLFIRLLAPFDTNRLMRPLPVSDVNSLSATPSLRMRHSSASQLPVATAIFGMSPSLLFFGSAVIVFGSGLSAHGVTDGIVTLRRHLPIVM